MDLNQQTNKIMITKIKLKNLSKKYMEAGKAYYDYLDQFDDGETLHLMKADYIKLSQLGNKYYKLRRRVDIKTREWVRAGHPA